MGLPALDGEGESEAGLGEALGVWLGGARAPFSRHGGPPPLRFIHLTGHRASATGGGWRMWTQGDLAVHPQKLPMAPTTRRLCSVRPWGWGWGLEIGPLTGQKYDQAMPRRLPQGTKKGSLADVLAEAVAETEGEGPADALREADGVGLTLALSDKDVEGLPERLPEADGEGLQEGVAKGMMEGLEEMDADGVGETLAEGEVEVE